MICNQPCQYWFLLVPNVLLKCGGQLGSSIQVGLLWIPHSIEAGLFLSNVCNASLSEWCILQQFCFVRLFFRPDCERWTVSLTNCMRLLHGKMHNMFCCGKLCTLVLSLWDFTFYSCKGDDIKIQRRHTKLGNNELKRQFATNDR